jgi:hypothetical protein
MEKGRQAITANVQLAIEKLGPLSEIDFGLNRESVEWVEGFIERQRARPDFDPDKASGLATVLGAFLGECIAAEVGGEWRLREEDGGWGVELRENSFAFPFAKVEKQLRNGLDAGDSILGFYDTAVNTIATGRLDASR